MNTVTLRALTSEQTYTFATAEADKSEAYGLLVGSPAIVEYTGDLKKNPEAVKISADRTYAEAVGRWTVPDPIAPAKVMGVELQTEGRAQSINMATLIYTGWELQGEAGKSCSRDRASATARRSGSPKRASSRRTPQAVTPSRSREPARSIPKRSDPHAVLQGRPFRRAAFSRAGAWANGLNCVISRNPNENTP